MSEDQKKPDAPAQPDNQNGQLPVTPGRPIGEILSDMQALMYKVEQARRGREEHVLKLAEEDSTTNLTRQRLDDAIEEAEKSVEYFEKAKKDGLLAGDDLKKYESIMTEAEKLKAIREEVKAKSVAIFTQPGVEERIREAAAQENEMFDAKVEGKKLFSEDIPAALEANKDVRQKIADLEKIIPPIDKVFSKEDRRTPHDLYRAFNGSHDLERLKKDLLTGAEEMGRFRGKEKEAITQFMDSKEMHELAESIERNGKISKDYDKIYGEWQSRQQQIASKFAAEVTAKIEEHKAKERILKQKAGRPEHEDQLDYGSLLIKAAGMARTKYFTRNSELSVGFRESMEQLLNGLRTMHGSPLFSHFA